MRIKYLALLVISFLLNSCSDFDKAKKNEKAGNNAEAADLFSKFLSRRPTDKEKIQEADFFLGTYNINKDCKLAAVYFADLQKSGFESRKINEQITESADSLMQSKDFTEVNKLAECFNGINENIKSYFFTKSMGIKGEEAKAIGFVTAAKNEAVKKDLDSAKLLIAKANSIAPKSPAINDSISNVEKVIGQFQEEYDYNLASKGISHVFDFRFSHNNESDSEFTDKLLAALQKEVSGGNEFEKKRDAENVEQRYNNALMKKMIVKYFAALPEYDFSAKDYDLTSAPKDFELIPEHVIFPAIKLGPDQAEKIKKLNKKYYVEVIVKPDHVMTEEEIKALAKKVAQESYGTSDSNEKTAAESFATSMFLQNPRIIYKIVNAKCVIEGMGTLYMPR